MISVVINTLNEENNLARAIKSVKNFADEVIVVDMHSDDKTVQIAKEFGAKVYSHERTNYVEPARNFAISKAQGDWILILDADEEVTKELSKELEKLSKQEKVQIYRLARKNIVFGKWLQYSRWWPDYNIRFFKKGAVVWHDEIHSVPITNGIADQVASKEQLALKHHHYETVEQFIDRMNRYTTIQSRRLDENDYKFVWQDIIKRPANEFLSRYFAGHGYKDGVHGLALASLQSLSELIVYLKVWQLQKFTQEKVAVTEVIDEMRKTQSDYHYWQADAKVNEHGGLHNRIKRKLKLP